MSTPCAASEDRLDAARVGLFRLRLQLCTETVLVYAQQKTEMEKLNARRSDGRNELARPSEL